MYYSLVHFPDIDRSKINDFRFKYDPYSNLIDAHISIVFPVPDAVGKENLIKHIENKLLTQKSFDIHILGLEKAWDNWLFLVLKEGKEEIVKLHDILYEDILSEFLRKDIKFIPHIAIGLFTEKDGNYNLKDPKAIPLDEALYKKALLEAENSAFDFNSKVTKLSLVEIDDNFTRTTVVKEFQL